MENIYTYDFDKLTYNKIKLKFFQRNQKMIIIIIGILLLINIVLLSLLELNTNYYKQLYLSNQYIETNLYDIDKKINNIYDINKNDSINLSYKNLLSNSYIIELDTDKYINKLNTIKNEYLLIKDLSLLKYIKNRYIPTGKPIQNDSLCIGSVFGNRMHPIKKEIKFHFGIDINENIGAPIHTTANGYVSKIVYNSTEGYGNYVVITHEFGYSTLYAHMDNIYVKLNQYVFLDDIIGTVGNTGLSTSSHLHYEIRFNNIPIDPLTLLKIN